MPHSASHGPDHGPIFDPFRFLASLATLGIIVFIDYSLATLLYRFLLSIFG